MGSSSNDDLREMMKTLASNTVTLQQNVVSFQQETKYSQLGEANGASNFKCGEIGSTNEWKIVLPSIESKREC